MGRWVAVAKADDIRPGAMKKVLVDGWFEILLVNVGGELHALENLCTHEEGDLSSGMLLGDTITCLDHLAKFDVKTGRVLTQPHHGRAKPLAKFPLKVEGSVRISMFSHPLVLGFGSIVRIG